MQNRALNVFLVDDSAMIRQRLTSLLAPVSGVAIVGEADTAAQAIDGILSNRPDCVVLDLNLRSGRGLDVLNAVRRRLPDVVFIVLTNHSELQYRLACLRAGARHFLDKSSDFDRVQDLVAQIATSHRLNGEGPCKQ